MCATEREVAHTNLVPDWAIAAGGLVAGGM